MSEPTVHAPTDKQAAKAWDQIMKIAEAHCLIVSAAGGVATLAMPDEQRKAGLRDQVLRAHVRRECLPGAEEHDGP